MLIVVRFFCNISPKFSFVDFILIVLERFFPHPAFCSKLSDFLNFFLIKKKSTFFQHYNYFFVWRVRRLFPSHFSDSDFFSRHRCHYFLIFQKAPDFPTFFSSIFPNFSDAIIFFCSFDFFSCFFHLLQSFSCWENFFSVYFPEKLSELPKKVSWTVFS